MLSDLHNRSAILLVFTFTATPAEVFGHYFFVLSDDLHHSVICEIMLELKILNEEELAYCDKLHSDYHKSVFLLDRMLVTDTVSIVQFCQLLQNENHHKEVGHMLLNGKD